MKDINRQVTKPRDQIANKHMKIFLNLTKNQRNAKTDTTFSPITLAKDSNDWLIPSMDKN